MNRVAGPDFATLMTDFRESARRLGWRVFDLSNGGVVLSHLGPDTISLVSGLHGDERSGPLYLARLLRRWVTADRPSGGVIVIPIVNDDGWDRGHRLWRGLDLNQEFRPETTVRHMHEVMAALDDARPLLHWDLHEDDEINECYTFGLESDPHGLGERLAQHLGCPVEAWNEFDFSSECHVRRSTGTRFAVTTEVKPTWPLERRFAWLDEAWSFLLNERNLAAKRQGVAP